MLSKVHALQPALAVPAHELAKSMMHVQGGATGLGARLEDKAHGACAGTDQERHATHGGHSLPEPGRLRGPLPAWSQVFSHAPHQAVPGDGAAVRRREGSVLHSPVWIPRLHPRLLVSHRSSQNFVAVYARACTSEEQWAFGLRPLQLCADTHMLA